MAPSGIDLKLRLTLREGTVYYFTERTLTSAEPHYFIVVHSDPLTQQVLLLSVVTSKVEEVKRRRADCLATVVELSPKDFKVFTKLSIVDCNSLKTIPLAEFSERLASLVVGSFSKPSFSSPCLCVSVAALITSPGKRQMRFGCQSFIKRASDARENTAATTSTNHGP